MGILDGRIAIVTGPSRGIGAEIARRFGQEGAAVAVAARTTEEGTSPLAGTISQTAEQIRSAGGVAVAIRADLSNPADRELLVAETSRQSDQSPGAPTRGGVCARRAPSFPRGRILDTARPAARG